MTNTNASPQTNNLNAQERLLNRKMLRQVVPVSDMTIWRWEQKAFFPKHLIINKRNYWFLSEVRAWLATHGHKDVPSKKEHHA
jgi:predicted DNA-binding transcriptional regulator AlpA